MPRVNHIDLEKVIDSASFYLLSQIVKSSNPEIFDPAEGGFL